MPTVTIPSGKFEVGSPEAEAEAKVLLYAYNLPESTTGEKSSLNRQIQQLGFSVPGTGGGPSKTAIRVQEARKQMEAQAQAQAEASKGKDKASK